MCNYKKKNTLIWIQMPVLDNSGLFLFYLTLFYDEEKEIKEGASL
jgi:hypothetical protein